MSAATLGHERAKVALESVQKIVNKQNVAKKFRSYAESLPAIIVRNGLGQALAMEAASGKVGTNATKDEEIAHRELYNMLSNWLLKKVFQRGGGIRPMQVIEEIIKSDQTTYMHAQEEALHFMQWVKRFANAMIEREQND